MKRKDLKAKKYTHHHTGSKRGYVSRKSVLDELPATEYAGKFGTGYTVDTPRWDTTQFCDVEYWVK